MRTYPTLCAAALIAALAGGLTGCGSQPTQSSTTVMPYSGSAASTSYVEYGRVSDIQLIRTEEHRNTSGGGAILGAVVGGVLGNQIGAGSGKDVATGLGVIGGAVVGNNIEKNRGNQVIETYRLDIRLERGGNRMYDVSTPADLRVGDRVRIENGIVSRL